MILKDILYRIKVGPSLHAKRKRKPPLRRSMKKMWVQFLLTIPTCCRKKIGLLLPEERRE